MSLGVEVGSDPVRTGRVPCGRSVSGYREEVCRPLPRRGRDPEVSVRSGIVNRGTSYVPTVLL